MLGNKLGMFCSTGRPNKSRKSTHQHKVTATVNNHNTDDANQNGANYNNQSQLPNQTTASPYRYVVAEFHPAADDEISVVPGDFVIEQFMDTSDGRWVHVLSPRTNKQGFVPFEVLSTQPLQSEKSKKKLPRRLPVIERSSLHQHNRSHHHHSHHDHHHNHKPSRALLNENGLIVKHDHMPDSHHLRYDLDHSAPGSSEKHSFQKFPFIDPLSPTYYNIPEPCILDSQPFHCEEPRTYVATHNFSPREEKDLDVKAGEYLEVLNKDDPDWYWVRRCYNLQEGFVPAKYLLDYEQVKLMSNRGNSTITMRSSNMNDAHTYLNHRPDRESLTTDQQSIF